MKLLLNAASKFLTGIVLVGLLLFLPAGTILYPNAWLMMALLFVPMLALGIVLWKRAPELLAKRLNHREQESDQRQVVALSGLLFVAGFLVAGLDFRFGWSQLPVWLVGIASVLFVFSCGLYAEVMRENAYLSRTVEVQENQKVIDTGLYGIVRHPMYAATVLLFLSLPLVLGSGWALIPFLIYPLLMVKRILNEESILEKGLPGYAAYKQRVKYRLIPFLW